MDHLNCSSACTTCQTDGIGDAIADSQLPSHKRKVRMEEDALPREDVDFSLVAITGETERTGSCTANSLNSKL